MNRTWALEGTYKTVKEPLLFPHVPLVKKSSFPQRSRCLNFISTFSFAVFSFPIREGNNRQRDNQLFYSKSDVFPFGRLLGGAEQTYQTSMDENCNYVVNEPLTTPDSDYAKTIVEGKRKTSGSQRRCDYRQTLPSSTESEKGKSRLMIVTRAKKKVDNSGLKLLKFHWT